jgi:hypothetical protein
MMNAGNLCSDAVQPNITVHLPESPLTQRTTDFSPILLSVLCGAGSKSTLVSSKFQICYVCWCDNLLADVPNPAINHGMILMDHSLVGHYTKSVTAEEIFEAVPQLQWLHLLHFCIPIHWVVLLVFLRVFLHSLSSIFMIFDDGPLLHWMGVCRQYSICLHLCSPSVALHRL